MRTFVITGLLALLPVGALVAAVRDSAKPLVGTVVAADGSPAAGAVVWAAKHTYGPLERQETVADAKGRYKLDLEPGTWFLWRGAARREARGPHGMSRSRSSAARRPSR